MKITASKINIKNQFIPVELLKEKSKFCSDAVLMESGISMTEHL